MSWVPSVDCSNDPKALYALAASTAPGGFCTSPPVYFKDVSLPMARMCMKGITLCTGRTNGAAGLPQMLDEIAKGVLDPLAIQPRIVPWHAAPDALLSSEPKIVVECSPSSSNVPRSERQRTQP